MLAFHNFHNTTYQHSNDNSSLAEQTEVLVTSMCKKAMATPLSLIEERNLIQRIRSTVLYLTGFVTVYASYGIFANNSDFKDVAAIVFAFMFSAVGIGLVAVAASVVNLLSSFGQNYNILSSPWFSPLLRH